MPECSVWFCVSAVLAHLLSLALLYLVVAAQVRASQRAALAATVEFVKLLLSSGLVQLVPQATPCDDHSCDCDDDCGEEA
jgi:hypothetical protein